MSPLPEPPARRLLEKLRKPLVLVFLGLHLVPGHEAGPEGGDRNLLLVCKDQDALRKLGPLPAGPFVAPSLQATSGEDDFCGRGNDGDCASDGSDIVLYCGALA